MSLAAHSDTILALIILGMVLFGLRCNACCVTGLSSFTIEHCAGFINPSCARQLIFGIQRCKFLGEQVPRNALSAQNAAPAPVIVTQRFYGPQRKILVRGVAPKVGSSGAPLAWMVS